MSKNLETISKLKFAIKKRHMEFLGHNEERESWAGEVRMKRRVT